MRWWTSLTLRLCSSLATFPSEYSLQWCRGTFCVENHISAAQLQLKMLGHYHLNHRPPLKQAHFLASLPAEYRDGLCQEIPGMMTTALLLVAECLLYTSVQHSLLVGRIAHGVLASLGEPQTVVASGGWPIQAAMDRFERTKQKLEANTKPQSVDIVVVHCAEDLSWIVTLQLPPEGRFFLYEKCNSSEPVLPGLRFPLIREVISDRNDRLSNLPARRDECNGYAAHLSHTSEPDFRVPDYTVFLHGEPADHWNQFTFDYFRLVLRAMSLGRFVDVPFLHLSSPRLVAVKNPCLDYVFEFLFGRPAKSLLLTYCCSQFVVSRERLKQAWTVLPKLRQLVDGSVPDLCDRVGPSYEQYPGQRLSYCFSIEFIWHAIFGENENQPLRSDDARIPLFLRWKDNEESLPKWREQHFFGFSTVSSQLVTTLET